jgi:hypothetical protein
LLKSAGARIAVERTAAAGPLIDSSVLRGQFGPAHLLATVVIVLDPTDRPIPRIAPLVEALERHGVRWVMSGSTVPARYGAALQPNDLDVVPALDVVNLSRLARLLDEVQAVPAFVPPPYEGPTLAECRAWRPEPPTEAQLDYLFVTALGMLDIPPRITGTYEELMATAQPVTIAGVQVSICDPRQVLDRLPAKRRDKDIERARTYADLRRRIDEHAGPDPGVIAALDARWTG